MYRKGIEDSFRSLYSSTCTYCGRRYVLGLIHKYFSLKIAVEYSTLLKGSFLTASLLYPDVSLSKNLRVIQDIKLKLYFVLKCL